MTLFAFLLVVISAVSHALWNFASKKVAGNLSILWIGIIIGNILVFPFAMYLLSIYQFSWQCMPHIMVSGLCHVLYYLFISKAYEYGDISTVYPISRGMGVLGTTIIAGWFLQENISFIGITGIMCICVGIFMVGLKQSAAATNALNNRKSIIYALILGCVITTYSINDKIGVGLVNPTIFIWGKELIAILLLSPYLLGKLRKKTVESWNTMKKYSIAIGIGSTGAYLLILFAMRLAQVSYIVAMREFSVVIGSFLGFKLLNEQFILRKGLGIAAITAGLLLIKLA